MTGALRSEAPTFSHVPHSVVCGQATSAVGDSDRLATILGSCHPVHVIETIETDRLVMRPFEESDLDALSDLQSEQAFWWFPLRRGMTAEETSGFLGRTIATYETERPSFHALVERSTGALVGWAGLAVPDFLPEVLPAIEVGWRLGEAFWGRGYATEAGGAAIRWGFTQLGLDEIISIFEPENVASGKAMDRLGFDPGVPVMHPRGVLLQVRTLTAERWRSEN